MALLDYSQYAPLLYQAFIDSIPWDNPSCYSFMGSSKDNAGSVKVVDFEGSAEALQAEAFRYNAIIMNNFIGTDNLLAAYVSASTPTWNTTYYNNIRNDLFSTICRMSSIFRRFCHGV
jgi:hypothetical protein